MIVVWDYVKKYKMQIISIVLFSILSTVSAIVVPYMKGAFIDYLITITSTNGTIECAAVIIGIGMLGTLATHLTSMSTVEMTANTSSDMLKL